MRVNLFIFLLSAFSFQSSFAKNHISPRIENGEPALPQQFPWQALLSIPKHYGTVYCGGALISEEWILTTAQCVYHDSNDTLEYIEIMLGSIYSAGTSDHSVRMTATEYIIHEGYDFHVSYQYEIAVIKLPTPVTVNEFIIPIALASEPLGADVMMTLSGWGAPPGSVFHLNDVLLFANDIWSISNEDCLVIFPTLPDDNLCSVTETHWLTEGDGGSPLITDPDTNPVLVGMPIWSMDEMLDGYVRVAYYRDWIQENTGV